MAVSKKDQNGRNTVILASSSNGTTIVPLWADPVTHRIRVTVTTVGDNGNNSGNAIVDENGVSVWTALSTANNGSIIEVYGDPTNKALLIK